MEGEGQSVSQKTLTDWLGRGITTCDTPEWSLTTVARKASAAPAPAESGSCASREGRREQTKQGWWGGGVVVGGCVVSE